MANNPPCIPVSYTHLDVYKRQAIVAERVGGQVKETVVIENLISVPETTGNELADNLKTHLLRYPVDLLEHRKVEKVEVVGKQKKITTSVGEKFLAPALIRCV